MTAAAGASACLLEDEGPPQALAALRAAETIGRPLGGEAFLDSIARLTGQDFRRRKPGPKEKGLSNVSP